MLRKSSDLKVLWRLRMTGFDGRFLPGPFSRLIQCLSVIGWAILEPPMIQDHEQRVWDLELIDGKTLHSILRDAWFQHVSSCIHRDSMNDLEGLDGYLTLLHAHRLPSLQRSLLSALRSGAFFTAAEHARYDPEKTAFCVHCDCEDDRAHWLQCPRFEQLRQSLPGWLPDVLHLPRCATHHLLVPRLSIAVEWRRSLWALEDRTQIFCSQTPPKTMNHLFMDGACTNPDHTPLKLAAWAVISATTGSPIAMGHLHGLSQCIDRAELAAMLASLRWSGSHDEMTCLWSDSQSTVRIANWIHRTDNIPLGIANYDLWQQVREELRLCSPDRVWIRWVPSHLDPMMAEDSMEDWLIAWNARADSLAAFVNENRPASFKTLHDQYAAALAWWTPRILQLREFYFAVAAKDHSCEAQPFVEPSDLASPSDEGLSLLQHSPLEEELPVNWVQSCEAIPLQIPLQFLVNLVSKLCAFEDEGDQIHVLSEVELVFALLATPGFPFPVQVASSGSWVLRPPDEQFQKPTLVDLLRAVQFAIKGLMAAFPHLSFNQEPRADPVIGLYKPFRGLRLKILGSFYRDVRMKVSAFTMHRPLRRSNDLARPVN